MDKYIRNKQTRKTLKVKISLFGKIIYQIQNLVDFSVQYFIKVMIKFVLLLEYTPLEPIEIITKKIKNGKIEI